ncbi:putative GTP-binding protein [Fragilariopsis cylindrus CCMP1102]|uniref:Putative GTP-binding protein n=1 Tax=Fragilariopsis cylindrus CCMP1102 TaxID=635003 RepID=A0A1E7F6X8_9STRA|nr:putative GTP-binding protein [Fragilariopsis cylindrus CCMP1102]|eukprot:OEU13765.1 putative GTP-binding protein [Fragilariopsis cylindrus CCMP1102]
MNTNTTTITNVNNDDHQQQHRCGYAGIVGAPNMGKSTLLNSLLKEDLCIATRRPQTTRHAILGVLSSPTKQCCLLDTPGVLQGDGAYQLQANMMEAVKGALTDSDVIVVVTDLFSTPIPDDNVFRRLSETTKPVLVVVNKIDLEGRAKRPDEATIQRKKDDEEEEEDEFEKTYTVSLTNDDVKQLLPIGPPLYDDDFLSDRSVRFFCSELIREALLESRYLKKELPYCCEVQITDYKEPRDDNITRIEATIFVERDGQKAIIIGKNGDVVKQVGIIAREKIERFLDGEKVFLQLRVKINKDWRKREDQLAKFGYSN